MEAAVVSSLLYDCQARVWWARDIKRLQSWVDRCYRYIWEIGIGSLLGKCRIGIAIWRMLGLGWGSNLLGVG